jgi:2,5-furandicarboxylate decarboxylase 1
MPRSLRDFITALEEQAPEEIVAVDREVDPSWEVTAVARKLQDENRFPMLLFRNVEGSPHSLAMNVHASRRKLAFAMEAPEHEISTLYRRYQELTENEADTAPVGDGEAPVKQNTHTGDDVDVTRLPNVTHNELDGGPFIDAGVVIVKDPDTDTYNAGIYRAQIHGPARTGLYVTPSQDLATICREAEARDEPVDVAVSLGTHPYITIGSTARVAPDDDEMRHLSGMIEAAVGEPMRTVECDTVDLEAPASSEFLIEGRIPPGVRKEEGPFGEYPWTYGPSTDGFVLDISAIHHRDDPIHQTIFAAHPDHNLAGALGVEGELYSRLSDSRHHGVEDVRMPMHGVCRFTAFVSIDKHSDGQAKSTIMATLGSDPLITNVVVVDDDINIYNDIEVLYAMWSRTHMDKDAVVVEDTFTTPLNPTTYMPGNSEKAIDWLEAEIAEDVVPAENPPLDVNFGIDATKPVSTQWPQRPEPPGDWEALDLEEYIDE